MAKQRKPTIGDVYHAEIAALKSQFAAIAMQRPTCVWLHVLAELHAVRHSMGKPAKKRVLVEAEAIKKVAYETIL